MQLEELEKMLTPKEAAVILGVKLARMYQYLDEIKRGESPRFTAIYSRGRWYIDEGSCREYAKEPRDPGNPYWKKVS